MRNIYLHLNIKHFRKRLKMSQEELGKRLGLQKATISAYEQGDVSPPLKNVIIMAELFDKNLDDLVFKTPYANDANAQSVEEGRGNNYIAPQSVGESEQSLMRLLTRTERELNDLRSKLLNEAPELAKAWGINH